MNFEPSDEQRILCDTARKFFAREFPLTKLRVIERDGPGSFVPVYRSMGEMGWLGLGLASGLAPEQAASLPQEASGSWLDLALLAEEAGRALAPTVQIASMTLAGRALLAAGAGAAQHERIAGLIAGRHIIAPAVIEGDEATRERPAATRAVRVADRVEISGAKRFVEHFDIATDLLISATQSDGAPCLAIVPRSATGITAEQVQLTSRDTMHHLRLDRVTVPVSDVVRIDERAWLHIVDGAKIIVAAWATGAASAALDLAVAYAKIRHQFGRPIGSFQAVQHRLADAAMALEPATAMVRYAAWRYGTGTASAREAAMARLTAGRAVRLVTHAAALTHGGYGFMEEFDIQLHVRRARQLEHMLEGPALQREIIASESVEDLLRV